VVKGGSLAIVLKEIRALAALEDAHVFERDRDEPIGVEIEKKKVLSVIAHRCKKMHVKVQMSSPSATSVARANNGSKRARARSNWDAAVMSDVRGQRCSTSTSRAGLQSR
jgi:hypothetical protein